MIRSPSFTPSIRTYRFRPELTPRQSLALSLLRSLPSPTMDAIAEHMGISRSAAHKLIRKAREKEAMVEAKAREGRESRGQKKGAPKR